MQHVSSACKISFLFSYFGYFFLENSAEMIIVKGVCSSTIEGILKDPSSRFNGFATQKEIDYCINYIKDVSAHCDAIVPYHNYTKATCYHFCGK